MARRIINWSDEETALLISVWKEDFIQKLMDGTSRDSKRYNVIAEKTAEKVKVLFRLMSIVNINRLFNGPLRRTFRRNSLSKSLRTEDVILKHRLDLRERKNARKKSRQKVMNISCPVILSMTFA